ncbi:unnamed protein product, partial [Mesorhabditis spiculigera]
MKLYLLIALLPLIFARPEVTPPKKTSGTQSVRVKGAFLCGKNPAKDVLVKLMEEDFGKDDDDKLDQARTDANGQFELEGTNTEYTTLDTAINIYHDCNDGITPCQRRWKFEIPSKYLTAGSNATKTFDIGTWNLELVLPNEKHDCEH